MEIKNILADLKNIDDGGMEKTAKDHQPENVSSVRNKLISALDEAMTPTTEKAAAVSNQPANQSATEELVKMAANLANSESEALLKEAHVWGAAVADGFMQRLNGYEAATTGVELTKTASLDGVPTDAEFEKFAEENPDLVKQAAELGYLHGKQQVDELKKLAFEQGYADASNAITEMAKTAEGREKLATISAELTKQASAENSNDLAQVFEKLAETPEGQEKLAAIRQGYTDGTAKIEKVAEDCFGRGYNNTVEVLRAL